MLVYVHGHGGHLLLEVLRSVVGGFAEGWEQQDAAGPTLFGTLCGWAGEKKCDRCPF